MSENFPIIGVAGQMRAGKDSLADNLQSILNKSGTSIHWERGAFAKAVKQIFMDAFAKDAAYIEKWKVIKEAPPDLDRPVRQSLQFIGDGFRTIKSSIWIDIFFRDKTPRICADCRYINELKAIQEHGGFNILIVRPDKINDDPNGSEAQMRPFADHVMRLMKVFGERYQMYGKGYQASLGSKRICHLDPPEGWQYLNYVVVNNGTLEDMYAIVDCPLVGTVNAHFRREKP